MRVPEHGGFVVVGVRVERGAELLVLLVVLGAAAAGAAVGAAVVDRAEAGGGEGSALQRASASADMSASANVLTIARSRSGLAAARLSSARACRGRLSGAVIVLISFEASTLRRSAGGRSSMRAPSRCRSKPPDQVEPVHHFPGRNRPHGPPPLPVSVTAAPAPGHSARSTAKPGSQARK